MISRRKKKRIEPITQTVIRKNKELRKSFLLKLLANFGKKYRRVTADITPADMKKITAELNI